MDNVELIKQGKEIEITLSGKKFVLINRKCDSSLSKLNKLFN